MPELKKNVIAIFSKVMDTKHTVILEPMTDEWKISIVFITPYKLKRANLATFP